MDFVIAIPTLNRQTSIAKKTLACLRHEGFLPSQIYLFVASREQETLYLQEVPTNLYNSIVVGELGIANQRNFINHFFPEGTKILCIDDDIRSFKRARGFENLHLPNFISWMFDFCISKNSLLFGFMAASNPLFFKPQIRNTLQLICGSCYGIISDQSIKAQGLCKEDYWLSFEAYRKTKNLIRVDFCSPVTTYWHGSGGLVDTRTFEIELQASKDLHANFPEFIKEVYTKKNGRPDLKLSRNFTKTISPVTCQNYDVLLCQ